MNNTDLVNNMLFQLIEGLGKWKRDLTIIPAELKKGHLMLVKLCLEHQSPVPSDIPSLVRLLQRPLIEWAVPMPAAIPFPSDAPLYIRNIGITSEAMDFLNDYHSPYESHQREVYQILQYCRNAEPQLEDIYRKIRTFLSNSNFSIITGARLHQFARSFHHPILAEHIFACFEDISNRISHFRRCSRCGWTLVWNGSKWQCGQEGLCGKITAQEDPQPLEYGGESVFRLKEGVHRYTLTPGLAETGLERRLTNKGYEVEMYPDVDRYDLAIRVKDRTYHIDVKDYKNPYSLAMYFNQLDSSSLDKYREGHVYIVIPAYRNKLTRQYIKQMRIWLEPEWRKVLRIVNESDMIRILGGAAK
ncbi:hypothetical protein FHS16_005559 [Paenibacillus endophyticus]|uniref:REase associating with pPIWI RE domain-containing protein n=1 Tax=Paenibacillus endophyticus TaxID=1294268 RepID=A0A7W5CD00_9BACL|nr:hypothetical protein [Paenibacillus endophyticus]MBB3155451.1 hypothetical protein [Paenibacillus endophyticus]